MCEAFARGDVMRRLGINRFWPSVPAGIYETKKGWLGVTLQTPAQWLAFCEMLGLSKLSDDPVLIPRRRSSVDKIDRQFAARLKTRAAQDQLAG
ncbi:CoA transferase [Bradyrhizobium sp. CCBAU 21359]|uniref:CoA transferase n=1 Tax=Bradyrhizobium sp. CCBAU 21359 TaxID=1325080 RepID=UPI002304FEDC|nr:CoA transferase [Bradyrhizobium sp. CCBAU 21359]